jgi:hypothetical protein
VEDEEPRTSRSLWDQEPFATFRSEPKRFAVGIPVVFLVGALVGALLMRRSIQLALGAQLGLQTLGFLWLYVPAFRRRNHPEDGA